MNRPNTCNRPCVKLLSKKTKNKSTYIHGETEAKTQPAHILPKVKHTQIQSLPKVIGYYVQYKLDIPSTSIFDDSWHVGDSFETKDEAIFWICTNGCSQLLYRIQHGEDIGKLWSYDNNRKMWVISE